jgi:hypothetical protein
MELRDEVDRGGDSGGSKINTLQRRQSGIVIGSLPSFHTGFETHPPSTSSPGKIPPTPTVLNTTHPAPRKQKGLFPVPISSLILLQFSL